MHKLPRRHIFISGFIIRMYFLSSRSIFNFFFGSYRLWFLSSWKVFTIARVFSFELFNMPFRLIFTNWFAIMYFMFCRSIFKRWLRRM